ncbi:MAG TPA: hypothetical protein VN665_03415 [Candidatus Paceibacterota bacterium]|nr:hypothetical protein [Candidatus Paceibacterota bacterium]
MEHHLSIEESIRFGWEKTRTHSSIVFQVLLTLFAVQIAQQIVQRVLDGTLEGAVANAILFILSIVLGVGFTLITLRIAQGRHAAYADIFPPVNVWVSYLGATILAAIIMLVPLLIALVACLLAFAVLPQMAAMVAAAIIILIGAIAAAYFALRYALVRFAILDDSDITKSLRTSARATIGHKWWLLGFSIVLCLLNILGAILLLVGLLVTIPVTMFAFAHVYVRLHGHNHAE